VRSHDVENSASATPPRPWPAPLVAPTGYKARLALASPVGGLILILSLRLPSGDRPIVPGLDPGPCARAPGDFSPLDGGTPPRVPRGAGRLHRSPVCAIRRRFPATPAAPVLAAGAWGPRAADAPTVEETPRALSLAAAASFAGQTCAKFVPGKLHLILPRGLQRRLISACVQIAKPPSARLHRRLRAVEAEIIKFADAPSRAPVLAPARSAGPSMRRVAEQYTPMPSRYARL
jgi:hypothetical protein